MSFVLNYLRIIHTCIFCESEDVEEEIESEFVVREGKWLVLMKYKYHCSNCNSKWEL